MIYSKESANANSPDIRILYSGQIHQFSSGLIEPIARQCNSILQRHSLDLNIFDPRENSLYLERLSLIRNEISHSKTIRYLSLEILKENGWSLEDVYSDLVRFRCIPPNFQEHPRARGLLCWHRDTFYANPACQINLWLPLSSCDRSNGIVFFPEFLDSAVENDSSSFSLDHWNQSGGFQAFRKEGDQVIAGTGSVYPSAANAPRMENAYIPEVRRGEGLFFASRHLHGTMPNTSGLNRYSLELRFCTLTELKKADPSLNVDSQSRGCFATEFRNAVTQELCPKDVCNFYESQTSRKKT